jgi:hypothetical protein
VSTEGSTCGPDRSKNCLQGGAVCISVV